MKKGKQKKGISLIVLVITIIVMIIIAASIILSISGGGILERASQARLASDIKNIEEEAEMVKSEALLECQQNGETLSMTKLLTKLNEHFEGSKIESNTVLVREERYKVIVEEGLEIKVEKNVVKQYKRGDVKASYTIASNGSIKISMELVGMPKYDSTALYSGFEKNSFLEGKTIAQMLEIGGEILYPDLNLNASQVYDAYMVPLLQEKTDDVPTYEEYIADKDNITKEYFGYDTAEEYGRELILEGCRTAYEFVYIGTVIEYSKQVVPELVGKREEDVIAEIEGYFNNEVEFGEILNETLIYFIGSGTTSLDEATAGINAMFGIQEERGYIFSREQLLLIVAAKAYSGTKQIKVEDTETTSGTVDWYQDSDMKFTFTQIPQKLGEYEIKITGPSGNVETLTILVEDTTLPQVTGITIDEVTTNTIGTTVTAKDEGNMNSGIKEYRYYIKKTAEEEYTLKATKEEATYTYDKLNASTEYDIKVEVEDKEGNVGNKEITKVITLPEIPEGFTVSIYDGEDTVEEGLVIYKTDEETLKTKTQEEAQKTYDQFVWVPVTNMDDFVRTGWSNNLPTNTISKHYTEPSSYISSTGCQYSTEVAEYNVMKESVAKYRGFYIARYEAGDSDVTTARTTYTTGAHIVVSKKGAFVYNYVGWGNSMTKIEDDIIYTYKPSIDSETIYLNKGKGAVYLSQNMYKNESSKNYTTNLIYGVQWDAALRWLSDKYNVTDSRSWGNYSNSTGAAATNSGSSNMNYTTGRNEAWKAKNIYDLAGNVWELTMEANLSNSRVPRGGDYGSNDGNSSAALRYYYNPYYTNGSLGFRPVLYLN